MPFKFGNIKLFLSSSSMSRDIPPYLSNLQKEMCFSKKNVFMKNPKLKNFLRVRVPFFFSKEVFVRAQLNINTVFGRC